MSRANPSGSDAAAAAQRTLAGGEDRGQLRRPERPRRARGSSPLVVELGEVRGEGCVLERPAVEPGGEAAEAPPEYARRVFGESEASANCRGGRVGGGRGGSGRVTRPP